MGLITRTLPPDDKGFKLTFQEMDNNLYYLQGLGISGFSFSSNTITISNPTGGTKSVLINNLSGLTINGNLFVTGQTKSSTISATTISATTIDLCGTNGTLYTDSISGCSPINVLSETIFNNGLSATTISGDTLYGDGSNLTNINGFITTAITLTSSQILTLGAPIELLPSPGINKYYVIDRIQMEYSYGTSAYVFPLSDTFYLDGCFDSYITKTILTDSQDTVCVINGNLRNTITIGTGSGSVQIITNKDVLNSNLIIGTPNGDNPTNGDGSLRIKITYKVETFGS